MPKDVKMEKRVACQIQQLFLEKKLTLSLAESCTGGALAAEFTAIPGCSRYFLGSIVAYSNQLKTEILKVDGQLIEKEGAVSKVVVVEMAKGVLELTKSNYSLAVSGVAGPDGGSLEKPVGTIWAAIYHQKGPIKVWSFSLTGNRQEIIKKTITEVLYQLRDLCV